MENFYQHASDWYQPIYTRPSAGTVLKGAVNIAKAMAPTRRGRPRAWHARYRGKLPYRSSGKSLGRNSVGSTIGRRQLVSHPTTNQENIRNTYRKRRVPYRKIQRSKRRYKRFRHMQFRALGVAHQVFRTSERVSSPVNGQGMNIIMLRGCNGDPEKEFHLKALSDNMTTSTSTTEEQFQGYNYLTQSVCDFQIRNSNAEVAIIDLYYFTCKRDLSRADAIFGADPVESKNMLKKVADLNTPAVTDTSGAPTTADIGDIGLTPFQCPNFCQYFTITKKDHLQLNSNQIMTSQFKSMKRTYYNTDLIENLVARRGETMGVVIVFRSTFDGDPAVDDYPAMDLDFSMQWTYAMKKNRRNLDTIFMDSTV